jgi:toxin ParE1/3/4
MTTEEQRWSVRLTPTAETDFQNIIDWTLDQFGERQARAYADTLLAALEALAAGPTTIGAMERKDIAKRLFTLHVGRGGRNGRHFVLFRIAPDRKQRAIDVLRLLHDAMDVDSRARDAGTTRRPK